MKPTIVKKTKLASLAVAIALIASACTAGGGTESDLGTAIMLGPADEEVTRVASYITPFESYEDLVSFSDAVLHVRLLEVVDGHRFPVDPEGDVAQGVSSEQLGLVFEVLETFSGAVDSQQITVDWPGYKVDLKSRQRLSHIELGKFGHGTLVPGNDYVAAVVFADGIGYRIVSPEGLLRVTLARELKPTVGPTLARFQIKNLDDLAQVSQAIASK